MRAQPYLLPDLTIRPLMKTKTAAQISPVMNEVSAYIARALRKPLPKKVVEKTKHHVLDTFAAMVSGSRLLPGKKAISYIKTLGGAKESTVIGSRFPLRPGLAMPPGRGVLLADRTPVIIQVGVATTALQPPAATSPAGQARTGQRVRG